METIAFKSLSNNNVLRGLIPTVGDWDSTPSNIEYATDGKMSTITGEGSKTLGGAGTVGTLVYDLGRIKTVLIGGRFSIKTSAGGTSCFVDSSDDNNTFVFHHRELAQGTTSSYVDREATAHIVTGRYVRFRFYINAAGTGYVKIKQLMAYELGL